MKRNYIISFIVATLLMWFICYVFNSVVVLGKVVMSIYFISPWFTLTNLMKYLHLGAGLAPWLSYAVAAFMLIFLWASLYFFVFSLKRAIDIKANAGRK